MLFRDGTVPVTGGHFSARVDASALDAGRLEVVIAFRSHLPNGVQQPAEVIERFGPDARELYGPNVIAMGGDARAIQVTRTVRR